MNTVDQPTANPTRKLTAAILAASLTSVAKAIITHEYPYLGDPIICEPLPIVIAAIAGYIIKDAPNT